MIFCTELLSSFCQVTSPIHLSFFFLFFLLWNIDLFLIIVAPLITTQPQGGPVTEGNNVTLSCNASGNPVPTITWTRNGSVVTSSVARISFGAESRELTITTINTADSGEYRCVANNSVGNDTSDAATIDVQCKYKLSVCFSISTYSVWVHMSFMVSVSLCQINFRGTK